jgi:hypothetical protein
VEHARLDGLDDLTDLPLHHGELGLRPRPLCILLADEGDVPKDVEIGLEALPALSV